MKYKRMVGSNGTMIAIRLVRSKLRKREDHHHHHDNSVHPEQVQQCAPADCPVSVNLNPTTQTTTQSTTTTMINGVGLGARATEAGGHVNKAMTGSTTTVDSCCAGGGPGNLVAAALGNGCPVLERTGNEAAQTTMVYTTNASAEHFIWQFPPPYTPPPQYTLYNDQDTLVHGLQSDRQGFAKGFRKNLGGRWRRLVKRKPESETCAIPPELKDQLKTIYVY